MRDDAIREIAQLTDELLTMVSRIAKATVADKAEADGFRVRILKLLTLSQSMVEDNAQSQRATNNLLMALIAELAKAGKVDAALVAERHLSTMRSTPILYSKPTVVHTEFVAEHLSHPGFPDAVPKSFGHGPMLIVDNDDPQS